MAEKSKKTGTASSTSTSSASNSASNSVRPKNKTAMDDLESPATSVAAVTPTEVKEKVEVKDKTKASAQKAVAKRAGQAQTVDPTPVKAAGKGGAKAAKPKTAGGTASIPSAIPQGIALVPSASPAVVVKETEEATAVNDGPLAVPEDSWELLQAMDAAIRWRAYELYLQRGGRNGSAEHDWAQAEQEVRAQVLSGNQSGKLKGKMQRSA